MEDVLDIGPLDDGAYSVLVDWQGLGPSWGIRIQDLRGHPRIFGGKVEENGTAG